MQPAAQPTFDRPKQLGGATGKGWLPGQSGSPTAGNGPNDFLAREVRGLVEVFIETHSRKPAHHELAIISNVARLHRVLRRVKNRPSTEEMIKIVNTSRRLLRSLGLDSRFRSAAPTSSGVPLPTGYAEATK